MKNKVFSLDLVSNDPTVIACDMSKVGACFLLVSRENLYKKLLCVPYLIDQPYASVH